MVQTNPYLQAIRRLGVRPKHSFGQHFCIDEEVYHDMLAASGVSQKDNVIEIGAGFGTLTKHLSKQAGKVIAVESDREMLSLLQRELNGATNVIIVPGDILRIPTQELIRLFANAENIFHVVANLPYGITAKTIEKFLAHPPKPQSMTLMIQKEVGKRLTANPGDMSMIALLAQWHADIEYVRDVPPESFEPKPDVMSAIVHMRIRKTPLVALPKDMTLEDVLKVAKHGFHVRRKMLANALSGFLRVEPKHVREWLRKIGLQPGVRAQELSIADWIRLVALIKNRGKV